MLKSLGSSESPAGMAATLATSAVPFVIIGALLYAAFFVKAAAVVASVTPPAIERRDIFLGVAAPENGVIWAVGSNGKVVRSNDDGKSWARQPTPTAENLQAIAAWDGSTAVAVGGGGVVLRTEDSGQNWQEVQVPKSEVANKLLGVRAYADGVAWAVGEVGAVLRTADFGKTWERAFAEKDQAWNDVSFFGERGVLVGEFGQIQRTEDGGKTWRPVDSGVKASLMSVRLRDSLNGVAVGLSGVVLVTGDGGARWSVAERQTREHLNSILWDGGRWLAAGDKGVLVSADADAGKWSASRVSEGFLGWHTQVISPARKPAGSSYILAGAALSRLEGGKLSVFGHGVN